MINTNLKQMLFDEAFIAFDQRIINFKADFIVLVVFRYIVEHFCESYKSVIKTCNY